MSRTSTSTSFNRALALTISVLVVLCGVFLGLGYLQGPKLSSAQVDVDSVTEQVGQQLRLFANQAVASVDESQVTIEPAASFSISTDNDVISVQFDERLRYATDYTVTVAGVTSAAATQPATLTYSFTTGTPELYYLDRGEPDDEIVRTGVTGTERTTVYTAPGIEDFVALGKSLVVSSAAGEASVLDLVSLTDAAARQRIVLPVDGVIDQLRAASSGTVVGFTLSEPADSALPGSPLYTVDLEASGGAQPVLGLDGAPVRVFQWFFVPGSTAIVALTSEKSLVMIDGPTVLPLGQYSDLESIAPDGASVIVIDAAGPVQLTLADGSHRRLDLPPAADGPMYLGTLGTRPDGQVVATAVLADPTGAHYSPVLVESGGVGTRIVFQTVDDKGSVESFRISPNGQYVAIETVPDLAASTRDGYAVNGRSTSVMTVIVDLDSGAVVSSFSGFALAW